MVVWGVVIMIAILVVIVTWYIVYILRMAFMEMNDGSNGSTKQEELLQLPSDGDTVSYTHLRAHETVLDLVCRLLLEKRKRRTCDYIF